MDRQHALAETVAELRRKPFTELLKLPDHHEREITCVDGNAKLAIWKEYITPSELKLVVQLYRHWLGGIATEILADGFRATPTGTYDLTDGDLDEYT